ncbi:S1 family peptidase [Nannocystaceae bacterium ST9]
MLARALGLGLALATLLSGCATGRELGGVHISRGGEGRRYSAGDVAERAAGSVGVVVTDLGRGLGFVVDPRGYMITNRHVVEDANYIESVSFPGLADNPEFTAVEIVYIDPIRDLALLEIHGDEPLPFLELATDRRAPIRDYADEHDAVVLLSRDVGPEEAAELDQDPGLSAHTGRIERLEVYNASVGPGPFLGVTALVEQGQSGGPVLDRYGRAIGVVTWTWKDQKGGFAIPIAEAARMLAERPELTTDDQQARRAEERAKSYVAALGSGSLEDLRRLTSPSLAREIRGRTITVLLERSTEGSALQGFVVALEQLVADTRADSGDPFPSLMRLVESTRSVEFLDSMGVAGHMSPDAVEAFFTEIGTAYMSARLFGDYDTRDALLVALQRVHSLDAARSIALVDTVGELGGVRAEIRSVDVTPSVQGPKAVAAVDLSTGVSLAVQMRMEWGDWYVGEIQVMR